MQKPLALFASLFVFACGPGTNPAPLEPEEDAAVEAAPAPLFQDASSEAAAPQDAGDCEPADMLVILDRSDSMTSPVGTQGTRIQLAIAAIESITKAPIDTTLRFGLQVLPQIGGAECSTQLVVPMALGTGATIANALVTMSPQLDYGTPIGAALQSALGTLAKTKTAGRKQYVLLVTDGGECCSCGTNANDVALAQQLAAAGVETFVVGFGGDDDPTLLNQLACAGHTASSFATSCTCNGSSCTLSANTSPTTPLYFKASDGPALEAALAGIATQTCCGCSIPK